MKCIFTSDKDFFKNMSKEELMNWANETMNFVYEDLGYTKEQVLHAVIHMDEKYLIYIVSLYHLLRNLINEQVL